MLVSDRQRPSEEQGGGGDRHTAASSPGQMPLTPASESLNLRTNCGNKVTSLISAFHLSHLKAASREGVRGKQDIRGSE